MSTCDLQGSGECGQRCVYSEWCTADCSQARPLLSYARWNCLSSTDCLWHQAACRKFSETSPGNCIQQADAEMRR